MDTDRIASFVATADAGVLSRAAERLGVKVSTISRHVSELETELGVALFHRTGRGVRLTPAGERFLERGRQVLKELELAKAEAAGAFVQEATVRLSSPPDLAQYLLPPVLADLSRAFPKLTLHSRSDVRRVSLVEESYDGVVRLGPLTPSDLIPRKLGTLTMRLYAAPGHGVDSVEALAQREFVLVDGPPTNEVQARDRGRPVTFQTQGRVRVSSFSQAGAVAARIGALVILPSVTARAFIQAGALSGAARWLTFRPIEVHLLRTLRHRGNPALDQLATLLSAALEEAERDVV